MANTYTSETTEEFSTRLFGFIQGGFTTLSVAFGIKSGLFNVLVNHQDTSLTSQEIADIAGLKERYVREWLGAMTSAHIVDIDPTTEKYHLPAHRVSTFQAGTEESVVANFSKGIPFMCEVFDKMLQVIKKDGPRGLSAEESACFNEFAEDESLPWYKHGFLQKFVVTVPELQAKLETGIRMLDVGCGRGAATRLLAQQFSKSHFVGLDIRQVNVDNATKEAAALGLTNAEYVCDDATAMPENWTESFDYVFFRDVLHDTPRPDLILDEVKRVMKKDGRMSIIELGVDSKHAGNIDIPAASFMYTISMFYCLPVSYHFPGSYGLGVMWGRDKIVEFLKGKGFIVKSETGIDIVQEVHFFCELGKN